MVLLQRRRHHSWACHLCYLDLYVMYALTGVVTRCSTSQCPVVPGRLCLAGIGLNFQAFLYAVYRAVICVVTLEFSAGSVPVCRVGM